MPRMTQTTVGALLKRGPDGVFTPSRTRDHEVGGLVLVVGVRKATWGGRLQAARDPRGRTPLRQGANDARRRNDHARARRQDGGEGNQGRGRARGQSARREDEREGAGDRRARRQAHDARRSRRAYEKDMLKRREPSERSRRQAVHDARKALALMEADELAVNQTRRRGADPEAHSHDGRQRLRSSPRLWRAVTALRLDGRGRPDQDQSLRRTAAPQRPKAGRSREHVPSLAELKAVWNAIENEPRRDLTQSICSLLFRRNENAGLPLGRDRSRARSGS